MKPTLSVVIPALNEEANIEAAVGEAVAALGDRFSDYELLLFNDGSTDRTGEIMEAMREADARHIRVTHNPRPRNLGGAYRQGVELARMDYLLMVPGDNENPGHALQAPFDAIGKAEIVIPYPTNSDVRGLGRHTLSRSYVRLLNTLFGVDIRYFNGTVIHRTQNLKAITIETASFAYQTEILLKLLRAGKSYVEVPIRIEPPKPGRPSRALRWENFKEVGKTVGKLFIDLRLQRRGSQ